MGLYISKPLTINQCFPSLPGTRNNTRFVKIQIPGTYPTSIESNSLEKGPKKLFYGEQNSPSHCQPPKVTVLSGKPGKQCQTNNTLVLPDSDWPQKFLYYATGAEECLEITMERPTVVLSPSSPQLHPLSENKEVAGRLWSFVSSLNLQRQ